jgi:hypothetical protein
VEDDLVDDFLDLGVWDGGFGFEGVVCASVFQRGEEVGGGRHFGCCFGGGRVERLEFGLG